jgi:hypothetical protein
MSGDLQPWTAGDLFVLFVLFCLAVASTMLILAVVRLAAWSLGTRR